MLKLTVLVENQPSPRAALGAEHGLSFLAEYGGHSLLFDCGHTGLFLENARALGLFPLRPEAVALSHGHYDHAGGFPSLVAAERAPDRLWTGPGFFRRKYSLTDSGHADRSPGFDRELLSGNGITHCPVSGVQTLFPGVHLVAGFPRVTEFETVPRRFLLESEEGMVPDDFSDELCAVFEGPSELVMLVGCAHPGLVNMVRYVNLAFQKPVRAVFGGAHLMGASPERIACTAEALKELGVTQLGLCHCTGEAALEQLRRETSFQVCPLHGGERIIWKGDCDKFGSEK